MAEFKLVISDPKKGKSVQREVKEDSAKGLIGKKIGDTFKGELVDMPGYEFQITGGSDASGFPMRKDVAGTGKKMITAVKGVGIVNKLRKPNPKKKGWRTIKGMRLKKTVAGNTIHAKTAQINMKITKQGREPLFEEAKPAEEAKPETPKEEKAEPKPEPAPKPQEKAEEPKQEKGKDDELMDEIKKMDSEVKKDDEDIEKEDKEIEDIEKELKETEKTNE